jgi:prepilin signal peptidase PulO-like enzyme (type II secretory pathway)
MRTAMAIFTNTPPWVFALLALLIWQGCMALRPSSQPLPRMLIIPAVFFLMGLSRLVLGARSIELLLVWVAAAAAFAALALTTGPRSVTIDGTTGRIMRPGSVVPLLRNVSIFVLQYAVAVVTAMKLGASWEVALAGQAVSGACAGYFLGWTIALLRSYRARIAAPAIP